ncbi:LOB domain-containing protein 29-like [Diospyros lotus]|uniref:LOB domain-containing protein 29-like n=1 Tax=Diospyros lotus TaxID=55363 RepID=UPI00225437D4|nr:LOB domain-containing protein 29-like [Diospyros lotus]
MPLPAVVGSEPDLGQFDPIDLTRPDPTDLIHFRYKPEPRSNMPRFDPFLCGACRVLRRQCTPHYIFAPYFCHEEGSAYFAAIHHSFGARNATILLSHLLESDRFEAVMTLLFESQARIQDLVYGCVSHILALQQQVSDLQAY